MIRYFVLSALLLQFAFVAGATSLSSQTLPESTPPGSSPGVPTVVMPAGVEFAPILLEDVTAIEVDQVSEASIARFEVPVETARAFAVGYVTERGGFDQPLSACLYLPKVDVDGRVLAHFFLFSTDSSCVSFAHLSTQVADIVARARAELDGTGPPSALEHSAHLISAPDYYSISVSAYSFRPPLQLAHRGLPLFLMKPPELPGSCAASAAPEQIVLTQMDSVYEAVGYRCSGELFLYSPYVEREVSPDEALQPDLPGTLLRWRTNVLYSGDFAAEGLERLNRRWMQRIALGHQIEQGGGQ